MCLESYKRLKILVDGQTERQASVFQGRCICQSLLRLLYFVLIKLNLHWFRFQQMPIFNFTTAGESHGRALIATIEGLPAGLPIDQTFINHELWRRQQGYGRGGRMKIETDTVQILTGVRHGETLGSPIRRRPSSSE